MKQQAVFHFFLNSSYQMFIVGVITEKNECLSVRLSACLSLVENLITLSCFVYVFIFIFKHSHVVRSKTLTLNLIIHFIFTCRDS